MAKTAMELWEERIAQNSTPSAVETVDGEAIGSPVRNVDADTLAIGDKRYRLQGFNAPETGKSQGGIFVPGQQATDTNQEIVNRVAQEGGFTNLVDTGERDRKRIVARQEDSIGRSLGDVLIAAGLQDVGRFTENAVVREQRALSAFSKLMPDAANTDPILRIAREEHERKVKEAGGNPLYMPKMLMPAEAQYAAIKSMVGIKAVGEQIEEINRLEGILAKPDLREDTRAKLEGQLEEARDKLFIAGTTPDFVGGVQFRQGDRTMLNKAYDQFGAAWDRAILTTKKQFYGFGLQLGEAQGWDWLADKARSEVTTVKMQENLAPDILASLSQIDTENGSWKTITDTATFLTNMGAGMLPMIGVMAASAMAAPLVAGGATATALATLPAALLYSGGFYADQPEDKKNSALAISAGITSAVLEKMGLEGLRGGNLFSKIGRDEVMAALVAKGATKEAAEKMLKEATKKTLLEMAGGTAEFANKHYATKVARMHALGAVGMAAGKEAGTEGLQTIVEMMAGSGDIDFDQRYDKGFNQAIVDAMVGGGAMGGALKIGGTAIEMAQWHSLADAKRASDAALTDAMEFQRQQKELSKQGLKGGDPRGVISNLDAVQKIRGITVDGPNPLKTTLAELEGNPGNWNGFLSIVTDPLRLYRTLASTTVRSLRKSNGELKFYLPILKSLMQGGVLPGDHYDGARQNIIGQWSTPSAEVLATNLKTDVRAASEKLRSAWQSTWSHGRTLAGNTPEEIELQNWKNEADRVSGNIKAMLADMGFDTSQFGGTDVVFEDAAIDTSKIRKNEELIVSKMMGQGSTRQNAEAAVAGIVSGDAKIAEPAKAEMSRYGVFRDPDLNHLFEPNIFSAFENFKHKVATAATQEVYLGRNGEVIAKLLQLAERNGEFEGNTAAYNDAVQNAKDWFRITTGNYNSLENYPFIEKVMNWGVTLTMLASLGKAAFSSIPEIAMSTLGTSGDKVRSQIGIAARTFAREIRSDMNSAASFTAGALAGSYARNHPNAAIQKDIEAAIEAQNAVMVDPNATPEAIRKASEALQAVYAKHLGRSLHERLGYNDSGYNTQARFETNTSNMKRTMQIFAAAIGLRAMTDATRIATSSMAADIFRVRIASLQAIPKEERSAVFTTGKGLTNEQYQSLKELMQYGVDVEGFLDALETLNGPSFEEVLNRVGSAESDYIPQSTQELNPTAKAAQTLRENILTGVRNMVDSRVVNPQTANLPKYYHDPRLRPLTAMTRFIAGLTANILPRLYRDYIRDGNAGMRYQAFVTIGLAMAFAHIANIMKDLLSYGDDENPYLKTGVKQAQRAIYGSGALGRGEGIVDWVMPLYDFNNTSLLDNPLKYSYNSAKSAMPPVGWTDRTVRAMYNLSSGNTEQGVKQAVRSMPLVGSFPQAATVAAELTKE